MARKKKLWNKLTISMAIHVGIDEDTFFKSVNKFIGPASTLVKKCQSTFVPLTFGVTDLTPQELTQVALTTNKQAVYGHPY